MGKSRWVAAWAISLGVAGAPLLTTTGATAADPPAPCTTEVAQSSGAVTKTICDDASPPETTLVSTTPAPNSAGFIQSNTVTFTFKGSYTDTDTDPIAYECQFYPNTGPAPTTWSKCGTAQPDGTLTQTYDKLDATGKVAYTFNVRALDSVDNPIDATAGGSLFVKAADEDLPDYDLTPATTKLAADNTVPTLFVLSAPYDPLRPELPMVKSNRVVIELASSEDNSGVPVTYHCTLNGQPHACKSGPVVLSNLGPGAQKFTATVTDAAGNTDPSPEQVVFTVPQNLTSTNPRFVRHQSKGYFKGDYLESSRRGATLSIPATDVREFRLLAPAGPNLGILEIRIGTSARIYVNQYAKKYQRMKVYSLRDQYDPARSGAITISVYQLKKGQTVQIDAILADSSVDTPENGTT